MIKFPTTPVPVAPSPSTMMRLTTEGYDQATLEVFNTDVSQVLTVSVWRSATRDGELSESPTTLFYAIQPGKSKCVDLDVSGSLRLELRGVASGAGLTAEVGGNLRRRTP